MTPFGKIKVSIRESLCGPLAKPEIDVEHRNSRGRHSGYLTGLREGGWADPIQLLLDFSREPWYPAESEAGGDGPRF